MNPGIFEILCQVLLLPTIDLFASPYNNQLPVYVSWHFDPSAYATDAFSITWTNLLFYAFPPFSLIGRVLRKIQTDGATAGWPLPGKTWKNLENPGIGLHTLENPGILQKWLKILENRPVLL